MIWNLGSQRQCWVKEKQEGPLDREGEGDIRVHLAFAYTMGFSTFASEILRY
jgi:hypothetical protein